MFRTRDYALILATILFLVMGISMTLLSSVERGLGGMSASVFESLGVEEERGAVLVQKDLQREERLAAMRELIAARDIGETSPETPVSEGEVSQGVPDEQVEQQELRCTNYQATGLAWNPAGLMIEEVEGARIVYRESAELDPFTGLPVKDIVLQLPVRTAALGGNHCFSSDVIGVARDGSLIRNSEVALYGVFGADTLIGYTLDGYPLYGSFGGQTDACGGRTVAGQYRYHVAAERDFILGCFSGFPTSL